LFICTVVKHAFLLNKTKIQDPRSKEKNPNSKKKKEPKIQKFKLIVCLSQSLNRRFDFSYLFFFSLLYLDLARPTERFKT